MSIASHMGIRAIQYMRYVSPFSDKGYVERVFRVRWRLYEVRFTLMTWSHD